MGDESPRANSFDTGIRGWLALFALNLVLLPISALYMIAVPFQATLRVPSTLGSITLGFGIVFCAVLALGIFRFFQRRRSARWLMIAIVWCNLGFLALVGTLWDAGASELLEFDARYAREHAMVLQFVGGLAAVLLWTPYFLISKRVKVTMTR